MTPMDFRHTFLDVAAWLKLPAVIVARPGLGTINHTLLTCLALRSRGISIAGVVINRYPADTPAAAEETNPRAIEKWGKVSILCVIPEVNSPLMPTLPPDIVGIIGSVDWEAKMEI
jgi:dethiobiotin synthetase